MTATSVPRIGSRVKVLAGATFAYEYVAERAISPIDDEPKLRVVRDPKDIANPKAGRWVRMWDIVE